VPNKTPNLGLNQYQPEDFALREYFNEDNQAVDKKFDDNTGHRHSGDNGDAPPIDRDGIANQAITDEKIVEVHGNKIIPGTIPASRLRTSSNDEKIRLINLHPEVISAITGNAPVAGEIPEGSITKEMLAAESVDGEKLESGTVDYKHFSLTNRAALSSPFQRSTGTFYLAKDILTLANKGQASGGATVTRALLKDLPVKPKWNLHTAALSFPSGSAGQFRIPLDVYTQSAGFNNNQSLQFGILTKGIIPYDYFVGMKININDTQVMNYHATFYAALGNDWYLRFGTYDVTSQMVSSPQSKFDSVMISKPTESQAANFTVALPIVAVCRGSSIVNLFELAYSYLDSVITEGLFDTEMVYDTNGRLLEIVDKADDSEIMSTTMNYTGGILTSVVETLSDGSVVTTIFNYVGGRLVGVSKS
jgi:hypothetical protein